MKINCINNCVFNLNIISFKKLVVMNSLIEIMILILMVSLYIYIFVFFVVKYVMCLMSRIKRKC